MLPFCQRGLHVIAKPTGPVCNLACRYCFYLDKTALYPGTTRWQMSEETVETYLRQYIAAQPEGTREIDFAFQGGEPTLLGRDFFRRVLDLQRKYAPPGVRIQNSLQTNGVRLDDAWCRFLRDHEFLVGLSLDGPRDLHDGYRVDRQGRGTWAAVTEALERLKRHGVAFNVLACVHRLNGDRPERVYRFFRDQGVRFIQFIPVVERVDAVPGKPSTPSVDPQRLVSPRSVRPRQFGRFLRGVFDAWVRRDVGRVFVRDFDQALAAWAGSTPSLCVYAEECGRALAVEHNGDLFSCDHFVDPEHRLGNIHDRPLGELANSAQQEEFGRRKAAALPAVCRQCPVRFACNGGCPKDRFLETPEGQPGLNYLCAGLKRFLAHIGPAMEAMAREVKAGRPAAGVMPQLRAQENRMRRTGRPTRPVRRNDPCPCGSGRKYKNCCLRK